MKQTHSRYFPLAARVPLAAACAVMLGAATALAQSTTSSTSGTSSNPDRYGSDNRGSSSSTNDQWNRNTSGPNTNASTSGAAAGSMTGRTSSDRSSTSDRDRSTSSGTSSSTYDRSTDRTTDASATASTERSGDRLAWRERRFVTKTAERGEAELHLAKLASEKASNPEVRSYAQKLIEDHEKVKSELTTLAQQKNVKLDEDDGKDRTYRRLSNKSGREFDEEFVEHMIEMHEDDVKMFEKAANDAKDSELRSFASKHIDHLREHLQQAQSLRQAIIPTGRETEATRSATETRDTTVTPSTTDTTNRGNTSSDTTRDSTTPTDRSTGSSATPESRR